jgi:Protein of unknown function (DUF2911)
MNNGALDCHDRASKALRDSARGENMRKVMVFCAACLLAFVVFGGAALAQEPTGDRPSPPAKTSCKFADGKMISVDYSSPRMRKRKIFGDLVPYGEPWRAGANEATTLVINTDMKVGDKVVPAGSYTLFTLPEQNKWTLIVSKQTGEWGIPYPGADSDFARMAMKVSSLPAPLENFTIGFDQTGKTCTLHMDWEKTRASIDISENK